MLFVHVREAQIHQNSKITTQHTVCRADCAEFHPRFVGLTGTPDQVTRCAKAYRVFSSKVGGEDDYLVDHSVMFFLVDQEGQFLSYFGKDKTEADIVSKIKQLRIP
jgi:cytochrome oxidase Cu insertion factor (SCO1/SenC/PrrC family)